MADVRDDVVVLKMVRLGFPQLFTAKASVEGSAEKFSLQPIMDPATPQGKANIALLEKAFKAAAKKLWADKAEKIVKTLDADRRGLKDGDTNTNKDGDIWAGFEDMKYITASNRKRPQVLNRDKTPLTEADNVIYGGCWADVVVSIWATKDNKLGGNGLFATLELVRFRKDGDPFGAAALDADTYLDDLDEDEEEEDLDDAI